MSIAFDLALQLTLGSCALSSGGSPPPPPPPPPSIVRAAHQVVWGKTEAFVAHTTGWGIRSNNAVAHQVWWDLARERAWTHAIHWSLRLALREEWRWGLRWEGGLRVPYGDLWLTQVRAQLPYGDLRCVRLRGTAPYGDVWFARKAATFRYGDLKQVGQRVLVPYGDVHYCRLRAAMPYGDVPRRQQHILHRYGDSEVLRTRWTAGWGELFRQRTTFQVPYWLTRAVAVRHGLHYAVSELNPVTRRCSIPWALLGDLSLQAVANTPELAWQGEVIQIHAATLSCDEDSPVWLARIEIAERADFARIGIGDPLTLTLGLETFRLAVDGKTLSRESVGVESHEITAVSPAALLDAPFAEQISFDRTSAVSAREAVEGLVDSIVWQLPDWIIPAGRLMLDGVTPLSGARSIVAAIGGIMESAPDGTLICRLRHPVSIPQYEGASVSHSLFDSDVLGSVARIAPARGFNRVTLANEEGAGSSDADHVDYVAVPDDATRGTVRARLGFARAVKLAHTGNPGTVVRALGQIVRTETETIEFVEGQASARYPVTSLQGWVWQHADLGDVVADGQTLVAAISGYSLLDLTYTTMSFDWQVALNADEEVQFVLVDA